MDWTQALTIIGTNLILLLSILGIAVKLHLHLDRKIDDNRKETNEILKSIQDEMKDFHNKLIDIERTEG